MEETSGSRPRTHPNANSSYASPNPCPGITEVSRCPISPSTSSFYRNRFGNHFSLFDRTQAWPNGMLAEHQGGMLCNQCLAGSGMGGSPNFAPKQLQYLLDLLTWGMVLRLKRKIAVQFQSLQILERKKF